MMADRPVVYLSRWRTVRGFIAYGLCFWTPLFWASPRQPALWRLFLWLLAYAGDWIYRKDRQEWARELKAGGRES